MLAYLIRLYDEGTLSEGQVAKATGLDRISIRRLGDERRLQVEDAAQGIEARSAETQGGSAAGESPIGAADPPEIKPTRDAQKETAA
jgi:hypothetical protein